MLLQPFTRQHSGQDFQGRLNAEAAETQSFAEKIDHSASQRPLRFQLIADSSRGFDKVA